VYAPPLSGALGIFEPANPKQYEQQKMEDHAAEILQLTNCHNLNVQCKVRDEVNTAEAIVDEAGKFESDFILMGMRGAGRLRDVVMGSQTWEVMKRSNIPVLAIPSEAGFKPVHTIVYVTSCRTGELPAIQFVCAIAKQFEAELVILYISNHDSIPESFMGQIAQHITYPKLHTRTIHNDHFITALDGYCRKNDATWLAVSPEKPLSLEEELNPSNPENVNMNRIRFLGHMPVLMVPDYSYLAAGQ
jgi:hypothetical protein